MSAELQSVPALSSFAEHARAYPEAAARAYNAAAQKHFGRFARLNKIPRTS